MSERIRFWGVGAFAGLVASVALVWWLFAGWIVARAVEEVGTRVVGARVDLDSAGLGLFPISITLHRLQVTNPDEPMTNAVEVRRIAAGVEALPLLRRKIIIDELAVEGLRLGTPRQESGAIPETPGATERAKAFATRKARDLELPCFEKPDVAAILASEELESLAVIEETRKEIDEATAGWRRRLDALPDKKRFKEYEVRVHKLKKTKGVGGALGAATDLLELQQAVRRDVDALQTAAEELQVEIKRIETLAERAAEAPGKDVRRLRDKYGLSPQGLANLSNRLLGPKIGALTARALDWWQRLEPIVARARIIGAGEESRGAAEPVKPVRGRGVDVRFPERNPLPDFLIRHANASVELAAGTVSGSIDDLTPDQPVHGKPLRLTFQGTELKGLRNLLLQGVIDRIDPNDPHDDMTLRFEGLALKAVALSESHAWGVELERGTLDLDAKAKRSGDEILADVTTMLKGTQLTPHFSDTGPVANAIAQTLAGIRSFRLDTQVRGTPQDYRVEVHSDMDRLLKSAVSKLVSDQTRQLESRLREQVMAKTSGPLQDLRGKADGMASIEQEIAERIDLGGALLSGGGNTDGSEKKPRLPGGLKLPF